MKKRLAGKPVYIVDGVRTPFMKARPVPGHWSAADLAVQAGHALLLRQPFEPSQIQEVIMGCVMPAVDEANIARIAALRLGCGDDVPAWTVQRNCASGMQAIDSAAQSIASGRADLVLAGGTEAMSRGPLLFSDEAVSWFGQLSSAKSRLEYIKMMSRFRPRFLKPVIGLLKGLSDPVCGLSMGQTAEKLAFMFNISRQEMDAYAVRSHHRLADAYDEARFSQELTCLLDPLDGKVYSEDDGLRRNTSVQALAGLRPVFDKKYGKVTAGNSSQVSDGACFLVLAGEKTVKEYHLPVLGRLCDIQWAALSPDQMGLGPVHAATPLLLRQRLNLDDIDYWEINEAFAAQVLACFAAWKDRDYCKDKLKLEKAFGELHEERVNVDGGAISLGHPVGASGARIVLHLLHVLKQRKGKRGAAAICIGGGQGGALLVENTEGEK